MAACSVAERGANLLQLFAAMSRRDAEGSRDRRGASG